MIHNLEACNDPFPPSEQHNLKSVNNNSAYFFLVSPINEPVNQWSVPKLIQDLDWII